MIYYIFVSLCTMSPLYELNLQTTQTHIKYAYISENICNLSYNLELSIEQMFLPRTSPFDNINLRSFYKINNLRMSQHNYNKAINYLLYQVHVNRANVVYKLSQNIVFQRNSNIPTTNMLYSVYAKRIKFQFEDDQIIGEKFASPSLSACRASIDDHDFLPAFEFI